MIENNRTTQNLIAESRNRTRTIIPAGTEVPRVIQHWNSEPPAPLTLYRADDTPDAPRELLGHFEVIGLPTNSDRINAPYLCVIANGNIYLCVRDYRRDRFLEVRRMSESRAQELKAQAQ